jgi:hypothetical protein
MAGDHAVNQCRGQCLEIWVAVVVSVAQKVKGFCKKKWNVEMIVVYHEMEKTGHCLLHISGKCKWR